MSYVLLFFELKGKQYRARKRIQRYLDKAELIPIQQTIFLLEDSVENEMKLKDLAEFLDKEGARVHVFKGDVVETGNYLKGSLFLDRDIDDRYQKLRTELLASIEKIQKRKWSYKRSLGMFETLKKRYLSISRIDKMNRPSNFRTLVEAEFENLEKTLFDFYPDETKDASEIGPKS